MTWWGWIILGGFLLGAELLGVDAAFYLVFIGVAAAITGLLQLAGLGLDPWAQWVLFSVISLIFMVLFRKKLYEKLRGDGVGYDATPNGETITAEQALAPGEKGRMAHRGTDWTVINVSEETIEKGQRVQISSVESLTLNLDVIHKD